MLMKVVIQTSIDIAVITTILVETLVVEMLQHMKCEIAKWIVHC